jgi:5-methylcytosine-specific restriction endonuclease McrA
MRTELQKEQRRVYDIENIEKVRAWRRAHYYRNKEKVIASHILYYPIKNNKRKAMRHQLGISKKYNSELGVSKTKEYRRLQRQKRRALIRGGGPLTIKIIQMVYEDNIKKYGTLTCIYCLLPIVFGKDTLEHKHPLSRGGTNEYSNLAIACRSCNSSKRDKTIEEFKI